MQTLKQIFIPAFTHKAGYIAAALLFSLFASQCAHADTVASTPARTSSQAQAACIASANSHYPCPSGQNLASSCFNVDILPKHWSGSWQCNEMYAPFTNHSSGSVGPFEYDGLPTCPSGYNLDSGGATCSKDDPPPPPECSAGDKLNEAGNACVADCDHPSRNLEGAPYGGTGSLPAQISVGGCTYNIASGATACKDGVCTFEGQVGSVVGATAPDTIPDVAVTPPIQESTEITTPEETHTVTNPDGTTTTVKTTTTKSENGVVTTTTTSTTTGPSGDPVTETETSSQGVQTYCEEHPNAVLCDESDDEDEDEIEAGIQASTEGIYVKDDRKTFATVIQNFKNQVSSTPFYAAAVGFFDVNLPAGSCSGLAGSFEALGETWNIDLEPVFCSAAAETFYHYLNVGVNLAATWAAFAIAFL